MVSVFLVMSIILHFMTVILFIIYVTCISVLVADISISINVQMMCIHLLDLVVLSSIFIAFLIFKGLHPDQSLYYIDPFPMHVFHRI